MQLLTRSTGDRIAGTFVFSPTIDEINIAVVDLLFVNSELSMPPIPSWDLHISAELTTCCECRRNPLAVGSLRNREFPACGRIAPVATSCGTNDVCLRSLSAEGIDHLVVGCVGMCLNNNDVPSGFGELDTAIGSLSQACVAVVLERRDVSVTLGSCVVVTEMY